MISRNRRWQGTIAGRDQPLTDRLKWGAMRMSPTDIADGTGAAYVYLVNGHGPRDNWTALFTPGERVRLRIVNASSMTTFNVRIPGLPMTIVQADGQNVRPVAVDEVQIGVAETYDAIVVPGDMAYTLVGEKRGSFRHGTRDARPARRHDGPRPAAADTTTGDDDRHGHGRDAPWRHGYDRPDARDRSDRRTECLRRARDRGHRRDACRADAGHGSPDDGDECR